MSLDKDIDISDIKVYADGSMGARRWGCSMDGPPDKPYLVKKTELLRGLAHAITMRDSYDEAITNAERLLGLK